MCDTSTIEVMCCTLKASCRIILPAPRIARMDTSFDESDQCLLAYKVLYNATLYMSILHYGFSAWNDFNDIPYQILNSIVF